MEAVAARDPVAGQRLLAALVQEPHDGGVALRLLDRERLRLEQQRWPVGELERDEILHDLGLGVDRDRTAAGEAGEVDVVALPRRSAARCRGGPGPRSSSRSAAPHARRASTVPCSSIPARWRCSTYSRVLLSRTTQSMPARCSRRASSSPAGPPPMMPTVVRIETSLLPGRSTGPGEMRIPTCSRSETSFIIELVMSLGPVSPPVNGPVGPLERGLAVLCELTRLAAHPGEAAVRPGDLVRGTGLARSVVDRVVGTLEQLGYVRLDGRDVSLAARLMELGNAYLAAMRPAGRCSVRSPSGSPTSWTSRSRSRCRTATGCASSLQATRRRTMSLAFRIGDLLPAERCAPGALFAADWTRRTWAAWRARRAADPLDAAFPAVPPRHRPGRRQPASRPRVRQAARTGLGGRRPADRAGPGGGLRPGPGPLGADRVRGERRQPHQPPRRATPAGRRAASAAGGDRPAMEARADGPAAPPVPPPARPPPPRPAPGPRGRQAGAGRRSSSQSLARGPARSLGTFGEERGARS